jgi:hypothetical protein
LPTARQRVTGVFGLAWIVLFALGGIALQGQPPAYDAPIGETRDFFAAHGDRYLWGDYIAGLAFILCLLPFVVGLRSVLGAAEAAPQIASRLVLVGGIATVIVGDAATAFLDALALAGAPAELPDTTIRLLLELDSVAIAAIGLPMALTALAAATVIWQTGVLPRWLAPVAALSGLLHIVGGQLRRRRRRRRAAVLHPVCRPDHVRGLCRCFVRQPDPRKLNRPSPSLVRELRTCPRSS